MTESAYGSIGEAGEFDFWHPDNVAPFVAFLCSEAAGTISGKVFGVQGDAVELYRPYESAAAIENGGRRWDPADFADRVGELFEVSGLKPEIENPMRRLRYSMTERS
jgi:hypothetical protein